MGLRIRQTEEVRSFPPLREGDVCFFYRCRPWSSYPFVTRTVIRWLYKKHQWNTHDGSFEVQSIRNDIPTIEDAVALSDKKGWALLVVPLNRDLPNETCQYGLNYFPGGAVGVTIDRNLPEMSVSRNAVETLAKALQKTAGEST